MISTMLPTAMTLGLFISVFILIAPDGIFCLGTVYVDGDTSIRLPCKHDVPDHEFNRVKWFKSTNNDVYENGPSALVSWDNTSDPIIPKGNYSIEIDFSLVIHNTSNATGIYRCSVTRNIPGDVVQYDVKVISYGKVKPPHLSPVKHGELLKIPCSSNSTRASTVDVLWYKINSTGILNSDEKPIVSLIGGRRPDSDYTLTDDFSLEIQNVSIEDEAVYRSIAVSTEGSRPSASDTNVTVYALPRKVSLIRHSFVNDSSMISCFVDHVYPLRFPEINFCLNCSVDHVYPMLFPELNFVSNNQTHNEDGTFNTSISVIVLHSVRNITLECSFPYFNYTGKSSLLIPANITDEDEGLFPTDCSASACLTHIASAIGIAFGVVLLGIGLITVAVVVRKMHRKQHQQKDEKMSTPEMERMV